MSVQQYDSNEIEPLDESLDTGLEEFGAGDAVVPRIKIVHKNIEFEDSLSGENFSSINAIILGLVKQRTLWHHIMGENDSPMCKSVDHNLGYPNLDIEVKKEKRFPWSQSGFDPSDYETDGNTPVTIPCDGCLLKDWGSHPDGKKPYCAEQFTLPILYAEAGEEDENEFIPAILQIQKTGIKPLKTYLTSFTRQRGAAYQAITQISLEARQMGTTDYAVPKYKKVGDTERTNWRGYSTSYKSLKEFLQRPPGSEDDESASSVAPENAASSVSKNDQKPEDATPEEDVVDAEVVEDKPEPEPKPESKAKVGVNKTKKPEPEPEPTPEPESSASEDDDDDDDDLPF